MKGVTMSILGRVTVLPNLPAAIKRLDELAHNLYWTWSPEARELFRELDKELFESSGNNPVTLLRDIPQGRLEQVTQDPSYLTNYASWTRSDWAICDWANPPPRSRAARRKRYRPRARTTKEID